MQLAESGHGLTYGPGISTKAQLKAYKENPSTLPHQVVFRNYLSEQRRQAINSKVEAEVKVAKERLLKLFRKKEKKAALSDVEVEELARCLHFSPNGKGVGYLRYTRSRSVSKLTHIQIGLIGDHIHG